LKFGILSVPFTKVEANTRNCLIPQHFNHNAWGGITNAVPSATNFSS